jgi:hypothetical protein
VSDDSLRPLSEVALIGICAVWGSLRRLSLPEG